MASESEDDVIGNSGAEDDLFGSEAGDEGNKVRELSDRELDSGDDEDRNDRAPEKEDAEEQDHDPGRDARILDASIWRHPLPKPVDGEASLSPIQLISPS